MRVLFASFYSPRSIEKAQIWTMPGDEKRTASSIHGEEAENAVN
jgi:hypothetical protein